MSVDPPQDTGLELLLQDISKVLGENQRFLQALKEDRIDDQDEPDDQDAESGEEEFEEL